MKTIGYKNDQWPLRPRSSECRPNFVRIPQNRPFELTYQTLNWLAHRVHVVPPSFHQVLDLESGAAKTDQSP
jgi:hypothetical protein